MRIVWITLGVILWFLLGLFFAVFFGEFCSVGKSKCEQYLEDKEQWEQLHK